MFIIATLAFVAIYAYQTQSMVHSKGRNLVTLLRYGNGLGYAYVCIMQQNCGPLGSTMADDVLKKLGEGLNCSICLDTYTDPKLLQCFHVYCRQCLVPLVDRDQQGKLGLTCPICRQVTPIPDRGVAGLQPAFHINNLLEIQDSVMKLNNPVAALEGAVGGATIAVPSEDTVKHCFEHPGEEVKLYCETCGELVCYECGLAEGKHHSHRYKKIDQAFQEYKEEITSFREPMEKQVATAREMLAQLDTCCGEITDQRAATEDKIHVTFRQLRSMLEVRETDLIRQLDRLTQGKLKALAVQRDLIEINLAQLNSCLYFMSESLRRGIETNMLITKTNMVEQVKELANRILPDTLEPSIDTDIVFLASEDLTNLCQNNGQVLIPCSPDPSKCHASGMGLEVATVGEYSTFTLHSVNFIDKPCKLQTDALQCEVLSEITGLRANCSHSQRRGQHGQYKISYRPTIKGRHQLHIIIEAQHIIGSPFSVAVKSSVENLTPFRTLGMMASPWGVAVTQTGKVIVTECGGDCVSVFSLSGEKLRSFGTHGSSNGRFNGPRGIAVDGEGNILVVDNFNRRIQKFTAGGQFISAAGTKDRGYPNFSSPSGIAFNTSNKNVYVSDTGAHCVVILNSDLTYFKSFGNSGNRKLKRPLGIACDSTGKVYVAESGNNHVQVFTAEGEFVRMLDRQLDSPSCIAIDASDMMYISQNGHNRIAVFSSEGQFMTSFGKKGGGLGQLKLPMGLAVDTSGVVYVCDYSTNKVCLY